MTGKFFVILLIFLIVIVGFIYFLRRGGEPTEVSPELRQKLELVLPTLSEDEDGYFELLAKNAISGGPAKDGIPSIDNPKYTTAKEANIWLLPNDIVFGVDYNDFVAAYPQRILVWHEIVNLEYQGEKFSVTYCPLTGTTLGFKGEYAPGLSVQFGVSGKLVNSNLIMYDRQSDSYWPQILGRAITGPARGIALEEFPIVWTTWEKWKKAYPDTLVLSRDTGFFRDYGKNGDPYGSYLEENMGYYSSESLLFAPVYKDGRLHPKEVVVGLRDEEGNALAILRDALRERKIIETSLGERVVRIEYDEALDFYEARYVDSEDWINAFDAFWFAWYGFYPDTKLIIEQ